MDRNEAIDILRVIAPPRTSKKAFYDFMEARDMAIKALEQAEIIRCAECKWFQCNMRMDGYLPKGVDEFECRHWCGPCDPVDFCSHAERRKQNDE